MKLQLKQMFGVLMLAAVTAMLVAAMGASAAGASEFKVQSGGTFPVEFLGEGLGKSTFLSEGLNLVTCENSHSKGEVVNGVLAKVTVTYLNKCLIHVEKSILGKFTESCPTITTNELDIVPLSKLNKTVGKTGLLILPLKGTELASFTCSGNHNIAVKVKGSVICESTPIGMLVFTGKIICKAGTNHGTQEFTEGIFAQEARTVLAGLTAESTSGIFTVSEKDSQTTTEDVTYKALVEQTA